MALRNHDKEKRPRVLLIPPPDLPVPAVQGGAVETLLTHLIRENEKQGQLELLFLVLYSDKGVLSGTLFYEQLAADVREAGENPAQFRYRVGECHADATGIL